MPESDGKGRTYLLHLFHLHRLYHLVHFFKSCLKISRQGFASNYLKNVSAVRRRLHLKVNSDDLKTLYRMNDETQVNMSHAFGLSYDTRSR